MSFMLPPSINLSEYSGRSWSDIKFIEKDGGTSSKKSSSSPKEFKSTPLLPRTDCSMFGQFPSLDPTVLMECEKCGKVLVPCVFQEHCNNPEHKNMQPIVQQPVQPSKSSSRNRKSANKTSTNFANAASVSSGVALMVSKTQPTPPPVSASVPVVTPSPAPVAAAMTASNGRSSKHKKSSKSNKRSRKEEKIEVHPVAASVQSPEAQSHPAKTGKHDSEHMVANSPNIPASHTYIEQEQPMQSQRATTPVEEYNVDVYVKEEHQEVICDDNVATSSVSTFVSPNAAFIKQAVETSSMPNHLISIGKEEDIKEETIKTEAAFSVSNENEENQENSPVDHMPMSPVAVVNIVPVQNYPYYQQYLQLPTQPFVVTIPCTSPSTHMYSYPKPLTMATRAIRKIGNTYLLQNQRLDHQRADIQAITRSRRAYSNASTLNHLPT